MVTKGFYQYIRHPQYTAGIILIWLNPYMTWNRLAIVIGLTVYILVGVQIEEQKVLDEFGAAFAEYRLRTPMLVPGLRMRKRVDLPENKE